MDPKGKSRRRLRIKRERWILNVVDEDTRYWLAAVASQRDKYAAIKALNSSIHRAKRLPETIKGDEFSAYPTACDAILPTSVARDFKSKNEAYGHINAVERLNRTLRKSLPKKKRRFRTLDALQNYLEIIRFDYNWIRSHRGLNGRTPAEVAGVASLSENKWQSLITLAYSHLIRLEKKETLKLPIATSKCEWNLRQTSIDSPMWQNLTSCA